MNTYYGVGGIFDEPKILSVARSRLDRGLARAGYRIVWLDFGWATGRRTASQVGLAAAQGCRVGISGCTRPRRPPETFVRW